MQHCRSNIATVHYRHNYDKFIRLITRNNTDFNIHKSILMVSLFNTQINSSANWILYLITSI